MVLLKNHFQSNVKQERIRKPEIIKKKKSKERNSCIGRGGGSLICHVGIKKGKLSKKKKRAKGIVVVRENAKKRLGMIHGKLPIERKRAVQERTWEGSLSSGRDGRTKVTDIV